MRKEKMRMEMESASALSRQDAIQGSIEQGGLSFSKRKKFEIKSLTSDSHSVKMISSWQCCSSILSQIFQIR